MVKLPKIQTLFPKIIISRWISWKINSTKLIFCQSQISGWLNQNFGAQCVQSVCYANSAHSAPKNFRLLRWQQKCQAIPTPFGVKSNKIKCENNKGAGSVFCVFASLRVQPSRRRLRGWSRSGIYNPESESPASRVQRPESSLSQAEDKKNKCDGDKMLHCLLSDKDAPTHTDTHWYIHKRTHPGQQCQMSNNQIE